MPKIFPVQIKIASEVFQAGDFACEVDSEKSTLAPLGFRYSEKWQKIGFALGSDLPMTKNVIFPKMGKYPHQKNDESALFHFLADHLPGKWFEKMKGPENFPSPTRLEKLLTRENRGTAFSALEFKNPAEVKNPVPTINRKLTSEIIRASESFFRDPERLKPEEFRLIDNLTSDLGGTKLKFLVRSEKKTEEELILRVRNPEVEFDEPLWLTICATLAKNAGIRIHSPVYLPSVGLAQKRWDRENGERLFCLSARTLVRNTTGAPTWLDIADIINREGTTPKADLRELFTRLIFDTLICNKRSTLTRIWFCRENGGWRLAPMALPLCSSDFPIRSLPIAIYGRDIQANPQNALSVARYFGLSAREAKETLMTVLRAVNDWDEIARSLGAMPREIDFMRPAFYAQEF